MSEEHELIKDELFKNITAFINEIDLTIDYLDCQTIPKIQKYIKLIKSKDSEFLNFVEYTSCHLKLHQERISCVLFSNKKVKADYYSFLNDILLFNNLLDFKIFINESKNTKKDLVKYLYSIYMSVEFLCNTSESDLDLKLQEFVKGIHTEANKLKSENIKLTNKKRTTLLQNIPSIPVIPSILPGIDLPDFSNFDFQKMGLPSNLSGIMDSILGNKNIMSIATDISSKMQNQQLNPMDMLSSLMSGNMDNSPLQSLVSEIQEKVDSKINSGEIDKNELEIHAKELMNSVANNPDLNSVSGMSDFINNFKINI